jgi:hypothetical protein
MEHRDYLGRPIEVGDSVIFVIPHGRELQLGRVIKLTKLNVRVAFRVDRGWNKGAEDSCVRPPKDVVKVDGPDLTMFLLKRD